MELVTLKRFEKGFVTAGWFGVIGGLCLLLLLNITLLTNIDLTNNNFYLLMYLTAPLSVIALFSKKSRSLGLWGLSVVLFIMIFTGIIFIIGWIVVPFP
ncbi:MULTISPECIES: hypothetical protein [unclassified Lysinibacillus]|uniref:hypothetical protein n=1 Tax=unclassified Lysinibacillus TaxID=2636778 RepID=UPI0020138184|nr:MULTISPECIES: hypothetical protein [unclassified Lysinibacillus]MCL1696595.1 hypothetical protein [Lysinibacillus sp. BPa_S21]MCL1698921.1 hypothetical protein [Lysinibacillus sp. Bpr_S20]